jgi:hypothetical protein
VRAFFSWLNHRLDPSAGLAARAVHSGFVFGAGFGIFDLLVIAALLTGGRYQDCGKSAHSGTCDYLFLALSYPIGAFLTGAVVGAVRPTLRRVWLAIPSMIVAMIPFFTAIALADVRARAHWGWSDSVLVLACSTLLGAGVGFMTWRRARPR